MLFNTQDGSSPVLNYRNSFPKPRSKQTKTMWFTVRIDKWRHFFITYLEQTVAWLAAIIAAVATCEFAVPPANMAPQKLPLLIIVIGGPPVPMNLVPGAAVLAYWINQVYSKVLMLYVRYIHIDTLNKMSA